MQQPPGRKTWSRDELLHHFGPLHNELVSHPKSPPFREPVDPVALQIPDYLDIIKNPMDLSTIGTKLQQGQYTDPWQYCDDVRLMFDNAWLYNKKSTRVHKIATEVRYEQLCCAPHHAVAG